MCKRKLFVIVLTLVLLLATSALLVRQIFAEQGPGLNEAYVAIIEELDVEKSVALYKQIASHDWNRENRDAAEIRLAMIDWRIFGDTEQSRARLDKVSGKSGPWQVEALLTRAAMEISQGDNPAARGTARQAVEQSRKATELRRAQERYALAIVEEAVLSRLSGAAGATGGDEDLKEAQAILQEIIATEPGHLAPAQTLLQAALLLGDGVSALEAWQAYYWLVPGEQPEGELVAPYAVLLELLPGWSGRAAGADRERLIAALAGSRFYTEAALVALEPDDKHSLSEEGREVVAYAQFLLRLKEGLDAYYGKSLAKGNSVTPKNLLDQELETLCRQVNCPEGQGPQAVANYLRDRFGLRWEFGRTDYHDLYMGHIIVDEERTVEQYGHKATFQLQRLDQLVSHGIRSWIFDDLYHVGGYAEYNRIVEFRPFRVKLLLGLAGRVTNPELREEIDHNAAKARRRDEKIAAADPYAYLPGLNSRLIQRSLEAIWAAAEQQETPGSQRQLRFLAALDKVWWEGPALAHEGRHIIDFHRGNGSRAPEFTAKLAETAFCRYPGIPLGLNILHPYGIGGHSEANRRVVEGYVAWMEQNTAEIKGLDSSRPLLPQLDLLTDEQLRTVARELDSLAVAMDAATQTDTQ